MNKIIQYIKSHKIIWPVLILSFFTNLSFYLPSRNSMGHDVFWHLSLIRVAFNSNPFQMPIFSGAPLQGYNWLLDFLMFLISKIGLSPIFIYSILFPVFYFVSVTLLTIYLGLKMKRSPAFINSLLFFILLATPFSYILSYFKRGTIFFGFNFPTAMQSVTALTNPQYAATVVLILLVMVILQNKSLTVRNKLIVYLSVFLAFGFKFYGGVVLTFLVFIETILRFRSLLRFQLRKGTARFWLARMTNLFKPIALLGIMIALSLLVFYDPFSSAKSGSIFVWSPLSTVHPLIEDPDAIYMQTLVQARYFLYENNIFSPRLWTIELFTIGLYFVFNTGTRIIGLVYLAKSLLQRKITQFNLTILLTAIFSFLLSILLIQKGEWWNTVQFFGYSLLLFNFFSAESIEQIWRSKFRIKYFIIGLVIILTVPLSFELLLRQYQRFKAPGEILIQESRALKYLEKQPDGIILQLPIPKTSYVSAFTGKRSYYADEQILKNLGVNFEDRKKELDKTVEINFKKIPIRYIYLLKISPERDTLVEKISQSKKYRRVFENDEVMIYNRQ